MTAPLPRVRRRGEAGVRGIVNRLLQAGIVAGLATGVRRRDPSVIVNGVLSLTFVSLPWPVEQRYDVRFRPWQREWISAAALVHTLGMRGPDDRVWWDHLAHALAGVVAGTADVAYQSDVGEESQASSRFRLAFVAGVTFGLGYIWEVLEDAVHALGDWIGFGPLLVHYGRLDAVGDLVTDLDGYLPAFLPAGGLELTIISSASRSVKRLAPERTDLSAGTLENGEPD